MQAEARIAVSREAAWAALADFGGIEKWSPIVLRSRSTTKAKRGVGAARHCDLFPRGTVEEQIIEWQPEGHLGVNVDPAGPVAAQRADFHLTESGGGVQATMTITFELRDIDAPDGVVMATLKRAVEASVAGLKYHLETGANVGTEVPAGRK